MANKDLIINADYPLEQKAIGLLLCTAQDINTAINKALKHFNLSHTQLQILHTLSHAPNGKLTVNQIKSSMIDESPNVSRSLNKLMENGYIVKDRNLKDQRVVHIRITAKGVKVHQDADNLLLQQKSKLSKDDLEKLYQILVKM